MDRKLDSMTQMLKVVIQRQEEMFDFQRKTTAQLEREQQQQQQQQQQQRIQQQQQQLSLPPQAGALSRLASPSSSPNILASEPEPARILQLPPLSPRTRFKKILLVLPWR